MGIADRRDREKEQRRQSIIDAAETLFFSKGIATTTMDDIATAAELSKGTLYLYFKSKEELFCAIILRGLRIMKEMYGEAAATVTCGLGKLGRMGMATYEFSRRYPNYFNAIFHHHNVLHGFSDTEHPIIQELEKVSNEMFDQASAIIRLGIEDGSIRPEVDPCMAALSLYGLIAGLIRLVVAEEEHMMKCHNIDSRALIENSFHLIKHALQNPANTRICPDECRLGNPMCRESGKL